MSFFSWKRQVPLTLNVSNCEVIYGTLKHPDLYSVERSILCTALHASLNMYALPCFMQGLYKSLFYVNQ